MSVFYWRTFFLLRTLSGKVKIVMNALIFAVLPYILFVININHRFNCIRVI